jgi:chromosome partitioning protein
VGILKKSSGHSSATPQLLVIMNGKGGVGKTTTAINLAAALAEQGPLLLVDADPQGSAAWWHERGSENIGFDLIQETNPLHLSKLGQRSDYPLIIVDTPPALGSEILKAVVSGAGYVLLPTPPAPMDLTVLIETVKDVVRPTKIPHRVLLTRVDPRSLGEALEAQNTLMQLGIPACNSFVRAYKAHERAALEGVPITQWHGKHAKDAEADYRRVAEEVQRDWRKP